MRGLVVGLGSIGRRHARNLAALGCEVWVCRQTATVQPEALGVAAREFTSMDEALAAEPDMVLVTNPTSMHASTAQQALEAGAHVLIEKPISHSAEGLAELLGTAKHAARVAAVGYNLRFHPGLARLKSLLDDGQVGAPLSARLEMGEYLPGWHPWEDYRVAYSARRDLGGGPVLTFSHELDTLLWLLGRPTRVTALVAHASELEISTEDTAEMAVQLASGALASVHVDFVRRAPRRTVEIVGDAGVLRWEYDDDRLLQYDPKTRTWRIEEGDPRHQRNDMYVAELRQFVDAVRGGPFAPLCSLQQGAGVLTLALAALRAAADGIAIDLTRVAEPEATWLRSFDRPYHHAS